MVLNRNPLDFIERNLILAPIVKLCRPRGGLRGWRCSFFGFFLNTIKYIGTEPISSTSNEFVLNGIPVSRSDAQGRAVNRLEQASSYLIVFRSIGRIRRSGRDAFDVVSAGASLQEAHAAYT